MLVQWELRVFQVCPSRKLSGSCRVQRNLVDVLRKDSDVSVTFKFARFFVRMLIACIRFRLLKQLRRPIGSNFSAVNRLIFQKERSAAFWIVGWTCEVILIEIA